MAKRGRKPKGTVVIVQESEYYFDTNEENALIKYIESDSAEEKNKIFKTILEAAFFKMIYSIIKKQYLTNLN